MCKTAWALLLAGEFPCTGDNSQTRFTSLTVCVRAVADMNSSTHSTTPSSVAPAITSLYPSTPSSQSPGLTATPTPTPSPGCGWEMDAGVWVDVGVLE